MNTPFPSHTPTSIHHFDEIFGVEIPPPALQRGWLHGRELTQPWHIQRIADKIGDQCWFSYHKHDPNCRDPANPTFCPLAIAGFWPAGGFVELQMKRSNSLEDHPRGVLTVYAESPSRCEELMAELLASYRHDTDAASRQARIGMLNLAYGDLTVERIPITSAGTVSRDELDLYYGNGMMAWCDSWVALLNSRRYGLTILTGAPGTGKTSLLRSLAHWLGGTHMFYFMPAARFTSIESGEIITFWAEENRNSKLRKVLILEDAESVLLRRSDDNREKVGTLLNLTDGMLGDALGLHVVCTLNCDLTDLDPALLRPGRLVAHREFRPLAADCARRLAAKAGVPAPVGDVTLAELFNSDKPAVEVPAAPRRSLGFHTLRNLQT